MNPDAVNTIKTRMSYHYLSEKNKLGIYDDYIKGKITRDEFYNFIPKEILNSVICDKIAENTIDDIFSRMDELLGEKKVDIIVGGPPCQAYSLVGRSIKIAQDKEKIKREEEVKEDPRNFLYKLYCQFLKKYKPKVFVFENVTGLLTAQQGKYLKDLFGLASEYGYDADHRVLRADEYGVLQSRRRVIVIGWRKDLGFEYPEIEKTIVSATINEMFSDLPKLKPGEENNQYTASAQSSYLINAKIRNTGDILTWHVTRPHIERDIKIYKHVIKKWNDHQKRLKYDELPNELKTHKNRKSFVDRFKVVAGDTSACHTMMAHISKDGHYFIHPDIEQARSLSVREAARIQSFPDNYFFEGSRTAAFTQIGNAVPPLMAEAIAMSIKEMLEKERRKVVV